MLFDNAQSTDHPPSAMSRLYPDEISAQRLVHNYDAHRHSRLHRAILDASRAGRCSAEVRLGVDEMGAEAAFQTVTRFHAAYKHLRINMDAVPPPRTGAPVDSRRETGEIPAEATSPTSVLVRVSWTHLIIDEKPRDKRAGDAKNAKCDTRDSRPRARATAAGTGGAAGVKPRWRSRAEFEGLLGLDDSDPDVAAVVAADGDEDGGRVVWDDDSGSGVAPNQDHEAARRSAKRRRRTSGRTGDVE
jgi:hypothetical protein